MFNTPKGTKDVLPSEIFKWHFLENLFRKLTDRYGYTEIRTPTFEHTELFLRGVGDTTDIVNKEMYTFLDKGNRSITLKPEGTASVARCFVENNLGEASLPLKTFYFTPVFRYEKPQSGRLREHHQFGVEVFGAESYIADVEVIMLAKSVFDSLGVKNIELDINSIGCPVCRAEYNKALKDYFLKREEELCETCKERLTKNPLRILDCKSPVCKEVAKDAPKILNYLCDDCKTHMEKLTALLDELKVEYKINPFIVRGLDYYTKTVFEFVSKDIGAQGTVCGGGRYNGLIEEVGGKSTPAIGFGMGFERLILLLEAQGINLGERKVPLIYIASAGESEFAFNLVQNLRNNDISADTDIVGRSLKAQMKYADKTGYIYVAVLGETEKTNGSFEVKNLKTGDNEIIKFNELVKYFKR